MFSEEQLAGEEWRPVVGWEDLYEVSDLGRVRSIDRVVVYSNGTSRETKGRLLKAKVNEGGSVYATLCKCGACKCHRLDLLVAQAFVPCNEDNHVVYHLNEDKGDCRATNLTWVPLGVSTSDYLHLDCDDAIGAEEWRPVVGWESLYEISDLGRLRSVAKQVTRKDGTTHTVPGKIISLGTHGNRYVYTTLKHNGIKKTVAIHNVVAEAFLSNPNDYHIVRHKNGDKQDNRVVNLVWVPSGEEVSETMLSYDDLDHENEEWRPVVGFEGFYEVGSDGGIRSVERTVVYRNGITHKYSSRNLSQKPDRLGYVGVGLSKNGVFTCKRVHQLVAEAFIPNPLGLVEIDHINGIRNDNRVENLAWVTRKENVANRVTDKSRATVVLTKKRVEIDSLPGEEWRDVPGYEGLYMASTHGRIWSVPSCRRKGGIMATSIGTNGYEGVSLCKNGIPKSYSVHRIIAKAFIPNPENLPEVNHEDENKTNNHVENLRWVSREENQLYGTGRLRAVQNHDYAKSSIKSAAHHDYEAIGKKRRKPIVQFDIDWNIVRCWSGACEASKQLGFASGALSRALNKKSAHNENTAYGYRWEFEEAL